MPSTFKDHSLSQGLTNPIGRDDCQTLTETHQKAVSSPKQRLSSIDYGPA